MRRVAIALTAILTTCGFAVAQEPPSAAPEQLQCFEQLVGNWVYEGPLLETVPEIGEKDSKIVLRQSWQWILEKQALETSWSVRPEGKPRIAGRGLIAWDRAGAGVVGGDVDSTGGHSLCTITFDEATKTWTTKCQGVDGKARSVTATFVHKLLDENTMTFQITEQAGGDVTEPSSVYTYKRDTQVRRPRPGAKSAAKKAETDSDK